VRVDLTSVIRLLVGGQVIDVEPGSLKVSYWAEFLVPSVNHDPTWTTYATRDALGEPWLQATRRTQVTVLPRGQLVSFPLSQLQAVWHDLAPVEGDETNETGEDE
jgi:hypothetical protein